MNTGLPLLVIGLIFGGGIGFTLAAANSITLDGHDHADPAHHGASATPHKVALRDDLPPGMSAEDLCAAPASPAVHDHETPHILTAGTTAPSLAIEAFRDPASGWNLHLQTKNFAFAPRNASGSHIPGEGHAHVYINGVKLGRVYGNWVHLDKLPAGPVAVSVTLNANDHRPLQVGDNPLAAQLTLAN